MNADVYLSQVLSSARDGADPDDVFYYLGGPMSGLPEENFPRFHEVAASLREKHGLNIVSPAELSHQPGAGWSDFLARDVIILCLPKCAGGVFLEGWEHSKGALLESFVLDRLGRLVFNYDEGLLTPIDRDSWLHLRGVEDGLLQPKVLPGQLSLLNGQE